MKFAIQIYGQFRSARKLFDDNIKNINKITKDNYVDVFILGQKEDDNDEKEKYICDILNKYNMNIIFYKYVEDYKEELKIENDIHDKYITYCKGKGHYFICKMWYRRYFLNQLFLNYINTKNIDYDCVMSARSFDVSIDVLRDFNFINDNDFCECLYFSHDTFFIGHKDIITKLMEFGKDVFNNLKDGNEIWSNNMFQKLFYFYDCVIYNIRDTYCSEVQLCYYIFTHFDKYLNIRYDFNSDLNKKDLDAYLDIRIVR